MLCCLGRQHKLCQFLQNTAYQKAWYNPSYKISATNIHYSNSYITNNVSEILLLYPHYFFTINSINSNLFLLKY